MIYAFALGLALIAATEVLKSTNVARFVLFLAITPVFFYKRIYDKYVKAVKVTISPEGISVVTSSLSEKLVGVPFADLAHYKVLFPTAKLMAVEFGLKSGKNMELSLLREGNDKKYITYDDITVNALQTAINMHNKGINEKVKLLPSFYASRKGLYAILFLIIVCTIGITIFISYKKFSPLTMLTVPGLIFTVLTKRYAEMEVYKKLKKNEV